MITYAGRADRSRRISSALMTSLTALCTLLAVGALFIILAYIAVQGIGSLNLQFLIDSPRPVGEGGGIGNAILGSLVLLGISSAFGLPIGICVGVYLSEVGKGRLASIVRFIVDTLTGIPSIVTGVFVYAILVLPMKHFSAFAGGVALALIMVPIVARTTEEMLKLVPHSLREGALALGAPQWRVTLGIARVSGETAPLLFTAFGSRFFPTSLNEPIASLTVQIYNYALSPYDEWHALAWAATLVLMTLILGINIIVRVLTRRKF
jgi:phosphate transport system permease protein